MPDVRLFRRNNKHSFSVQLSPASGVVEVHCAGGSILVDPPLKVDQLERMLVQLGRERFGCMGGFSDSFSGGWRVHLVKLGPFDIKARGFVQCRIRFERVAEQERKRRDLKSASSLAADVAVVNRRKTALKWVQKTDKTSKCP